MTRPDRVLVVEDETATRQLITNYLEKEGFEVSEAATGQACREALRRRSPDVVLLDINLPDGDGLEIAREIRAGSATGLIFVTHRSDEVDRIVGLELGGDDYLTKPINLRELLARVRSVLRRRGAAVAAEEAQRDVVTFDGWMLDFTRRELADSRGNPVRLTRGEFDLLAAVVHAAGRPVARDYLVEVVATGDSDASTRTVDTLVSRLRRKVEEAPREPRLIVTVQGIGYKMGVPVE